MSDRRILTQISVLMSTIGLLFVTAVCSGAEMSLPRPLKSAVAGRLWNGVGNPYAIGGAYVFVLSAEGSQEVLSYTKTYFNRGPDHGSFDINELPPGGDVILVAFHPLTPWNMATKRVTLNGQYQDIKALNTSFTLADSDPGGEELGASPLGLLALAGWVVKAKLATDQRAATLALAGRLINHMEFDGRAKLQPDRIAVHHAEPAQPANKNETAIIEKTNPPLAIVLAINASASMTEQRLFFCREGLLRALAQIDDSVRVDLVSFGSKRNRCFDTPQRLTPEGRRAAESFVAALEAKGSTDIDEFLHSLDAIGKESPNTQVIVISPGLPVKSGIQPEAFVQTVQPRLAKGLVVNVYLTTQPTDDDLLRRLPDMTGGKTVVNKGGRWDIPTELAALVNQIIADSRLSP